MQSKIIIAWRHLENDIVLSCLSLLPDYLYFVVLEPAVQLGLRAPWVTG